MTTLKPVFTLALFTLVSSIAFSDTLGQVCQYCHQLPKPNPMCVPGETSPTFQFCGAETWYRQGSIDCKQFDNVTVYCANGNTITYTEERWYGAGTTCAAQGSSGNHACH